MPSQDEMLMQDASGNFEVYQYNASLNAFVGSAMGAVGAPWVVEGIAADPTTGSTGNSALRSALQRRSYRQWLHLTHLEPVTARHSRRSEEPIHLSKPC